MHAVGSYWQKLQSKAIQARQRLIVLLTAVPLLENALLHVSKGDAAQQPDAHHSATVTRIGICPGGRPAALIRLSSAACHAINTLFAFCYESSPSERHHQAKAVHM